MRSRSRSRDRSYRDRESYRSKSREREMNYKDNRSREYKTDRSREYKTDRRRSRSRSRSRERRHHHRSSSRDERYHGSQNRYKSYKQNDNKADDFHAKKLAALDHEKFLIERQKQRESIPFDPLTLWPKSPPRQEINLEDYIVTIEDDKDSENDEREKMVESNPPETQETPKAREIQDIHDSDSELDGIKVIRVKAPSAASKPSINSFSSSKPTRYGGDLMPGEGSAMADFIAKGQRIPRRGEIGLDSSEIARFETAGYVMSGSRHHLMNAVRMRKENQVISAEEKKMISQMAIEERIKREEEIVKTFKAMVEEKMKYHQKNNNSNQNED